MSAEWLSAGDAAWTRSFAPIAALRYEAAAFAYLDDARRVVGMRHVGGGATDHLAVPIRAVARDALVLDARAVVMAHNHPSGDARPSDDDLVLTRRVARALAAIGVRLDDHVILTRLGATSFRGLGLL